MPAATVTPLADNQLVADRVPHGTASGFSYWKCRCDVCVAYKKAKDRAYYEANRDKVKATTNAYFVANREVVLARNRRRYYKDVDASRARGREYARDHADEAQRRVAAWRKANPEKARVLGRLDAQRRRGVKPTTDGRKYMAIIASDPCSYCGGPATEFDHITPVTQGGDGEWTNFTRACRSCNASKNDRSLMHFLYERAN